MCDRQKLVTNSLTVLSKGFSCFRELLLSQSLRTVEFPKFVILQFLVNVHTTGFDYIVFLWIVNI